MRVIAAAETDAGICKLINQDGYCIKIAQTPAGQVALAAVCDGMGGLEKGELASATAVREFSAWFDQTLPGLLPELDWMRVSEMWRAMIHDVDVRLHEYGAAHGLELGTTVTAMLIYGGKYLIAHVGDTRVYEVGGVLRQLTEDHTVVEREVQAGLLTPEAAELDPRRNVLLRCVGASDQAQPDIFGGDLDVHACYLLCSDGLRHVVQPQELREYTRPDRMLSEQTIHTSLRYLIDLAKYRAEQDNITALLLRVQEQDA